MSQVRRHDNIISGPVAGGGSEHFQDGNRLWVAALAGAPHAMAADRGRGAEAGAGRAVALTGRYSFDSGNGNPIGWSEKQVGQAAENAMGFKWGIAESHLPSTL